MPELDKLRQIYNEKGMPREDGSHWNCSNCDRENSQSTVTLDSDQLTNPICISQVKTLVSLISWSFRERLDRESKRPLSFDN